MSDDTTDSKPVPVTAVDTAMADMIVTAAQNGVVAIDAKTQATSAAILEGVLRYKPAVFLPAYRAELIIVNMLNHPIGLKRNGFKSAAHTGYQTHHPARLVSGDQLTGTYVDRDTIPGIANTRPSIGVYRFQGIEEINFFRHHDVTGYLEFEVSGPDIPVVIGFHVMAGEESLCVTTNMSRWKTPDDFMTDMVTTSGQRTSTSADAGVRAYASLTTLAGRPKDGDDSTYDYALTLALVPSQA